MDEVKSFLQRAKKNKAPGPDGIHMELMQCMNQGNLARIVEIMNTWWRNKTIEDKIARAKVTSIYKK